MASDNPLAARAVALALLEDVLSRRRALDGLLARSPEFARLAQRERAFARQLVATTLRRLGEIDALIGRCLERPLARRGTRAHHILRLGVAQLLYLEVADYAAIDTSVTLARKGASGFHRLVNGVLRRVQREGAAWRADLDSARLNTPDWLWQSWCAAFGEGTARAIAEAHQAEPPLDITVKDPAADWAARLDAEIVPTGSLRRTTGGPIEALAGFADGAWWVQDAAAALPARLLGEVAGETVIDLCAAPGGKTAQLAAAGAHVIAVDRGEARLARLNENLARLGLAAEAVRADARRWRPTRPARHVLLDAPCTATGTIRRHPDIPWVKSPDDVAEMARGQAALLAAAADMLAPGGQLVYASCSLQPEEGPAQIAALLAARPDLTRAPIAAGELAAAGAGGDWITADGELRTLPCHWPETGGIDGFFASRLKRLD